MAASMGVGMVLGKYLLPITKPLLAATTKP